LQGCSIRCTGCINPHLFNPAGGMEIDVATIVDGALEAGVEGITLLGGEPFDQAEACTNLAAASREAGLGVICFTGFTRESLENDRKARNLIAVVDLLVDGPYLESQPEDRRALVGSTNQRFIHLTDRYSGYDPRTCRNRVELRVGPDGSVETAGFLTSSDVDRLNRSLSTRRVMKRRHC